MCQDVCPYNRKFSLPLSEPAFAPRPALSGKNARSLALELLDMSQPEFSAGFKGSPMKRAKLRGLKRNAAVVLGNVGSAEDVPAPDGRSEIRCLGGTHAILARSCTATRWSRTAYGS